MLLGVLRGLRTQKGPWRSVQGAQPWTQGLGMLPVFSVIPTFLSRPRPNPAHAGQVWGPQPTPCPAPAQKSPGSTDLMHLKATRPSLPSLTPGYCTALGPAHPIAHPVHDPSASTKHEWPMCACLSDSDFVRSRVYGVWGSVFVFLFTCLIGWLVLFCSETILFNVTDQ